jgi:organic radical activating enzyme
MIDCAVKTLAEQYELIGDPIDLSCFYKTDGENIVFNLLTKIHRPVFENNQRILVVQPDNDVYSYTENIASDSLIFLQKSLQTIDISNFFVIVVTGNQNIESELKWLQEKHSTDFNPIGHVLIESKFKKITKITDTFCVNMWNHLYVNTQLEILPCCIAVDNRPMGSLKDNTVDEIINSESARSIRRKMLSNQHCAECETCYAQEDQGFASRRINDNNRFDKIIPELKLLTNPDGSLKSFVPKTFDVRLNNICNLKCRTCSGMSSSQLAAEEKRLFNNTVNFNKTPSTNLRNKTLKSVINYFNSAESIYFAGGEPLVLKEHYEILDHLISINNTDLPIRYNTNFTNLTYKNKNVLDYWKKFTDITVGASLDGHGSVFEYVRHGAKWIDIEKNLLDLKSTCPHVKFKVTSTISLLSVESVMELQKCWHENDMLCIDNFHIYLMLGSDYLSLQSLPLHHKKTISKKIEDHCIWLNSVNAKELANDWQQFQSYMNNKNKEYVNQKFAKINQIRDVARGETFETTYPHFYDLFGPYY